VTDPLADDDVDLADLPGYISIDRGDVLQTTALDVRDGRIAAIYIVRNPDKLRHLVAAFGTDSHPQHDH
jgi:RNA polymerase sigma-70 factor (ECF subfamily)